MTLVHLEQFPTDWRRFLRYTLCESDAQIELVLVEPEESIELRYPNNFHLYLIGSNWEVEIKPLVDEPLKLVRGIAVVEEQKSRGHIPRLYICTDDVEFLHNYIMDMQRGYG